MTFNGIVPSISDIYRMPDTTSTEVLLTLDRWKKKRKNATGRAATNITGGLTDPILGGMRKWGL